MMLSSKLPLFTLKEIQMDPTLIVVIGVVGSLTLLRLGVYFWIWHAERARAS